MGKLQNRIEEAGRLWGLPLHPGGKAVFGVKDGLGVQMMAGRHENSEAFVGILRWDIPGKESELASKFNGSQALSAAKVKPRHIQVADGIAIYKAPFSFGIGMPSAEGMVQQMQALVDEIRSVVGEAPQKCRTCGAPMAGAVLVNGVVDRICPACLQKAQAEAEQLSAAYEALPLRWVRALVVGVILMVLGALVWDGVILLTHRMFWILAVGIGAAIGWAVTKAAGKGHVGIQVMGGVFTVLSVAMGMAVLLGAAALGVSVQEGVLQPGLFKENFLKSLMESAGDLAFSVGGGLIGAAVAAQKAGKPNFKVTVEN